MHNCLGTYINMKECYRILNAVKLENFGIENDETRRSLTKTRFLLYKGLSMMVAGCNGQAGQIEDI